MDAQRVLDALDADTKESITQALWVEELHADQLPPDVLERLTSAKNSESAFGERMQYRLQHMLEHPESFTPSYRTWYEALIAQAASLTPHQAYAMTALLGTDSVKGYERIPERAGLQFPRDNAAKLRSQVG